MIKKANKMEFQQQKLGGKNFPAYRLECFCRIGFWSMLETEDRIWCVGIHQSALFEIVKKSGVIRCLARFDDEPFYENSLYASLAKIGSKLILIPWSASRIAVYDLETRQCTRIDVPNLVDLPRLGVYDDSRYQDYKRRRSNFYPGITYGRFVYMFGFRHPIIIKFDSTSYETATLKIDCIIDKRDGYNHFPYMMDAVARNNIAYIVMGNSSEILKLYMNTDRMERVSLDTSLQGFYRIADDGKYMWISGRGNGKIIRWNPQTNEIIEIDTLTEYEECSEPPFNAVVPIKNNLYLFPEAAEHVYQVERDTGKVKICRDLDRFFCSNMAINPSKTLYAKAISDCQIFFLTGADSMWHIYDIETNTCMSFQKRIDEDVELFHAKLCEMLKWEKWRNHGYHLDESMRFTLSDYIFFISHLKETYNISQNKPKVVGAGIYKRLGLNS